MNQALEMARVAYQALDEKKGEDIRVIDISHWRLFCYNKRNQ